MCARPWLVSTLLAMVLAGGCGVPPGSPRATSPETAVATLPRVEMNGAVAVLHAWDRRRGAAWAEGDVDALRRLYVAGSAAGAHDVALLRRYLARRISVPGLQMQLLRTQVLVQRPERLVLRVTERLATTRVRLRGHEVQLPRDRAQERVVELRRSAGQWRVASVRPAGS